MNNIEEKNFEVSSKLVKICIALMIIGAVSTFAAFSINKTVAWVDYLVNNLYFITTAVSGIFILAVTGVLQASWVTPYKRLPEAMVKYIPFGFVFMLVMFFGLHTVYEWTHTDIVANDPILSAKTAWLNEKFFMVRMVVIFLIWIFLGARLRKLSLAQDKGEDNTKKVVGSSAMSVALFALSICVASFDWLMSVEPHWFSTIYGVYIFAGTFVNGVCFITLALIMLQKAGYLKTVINENHYHDLGKWMFGFSVFWAYIWLSQFLLIWYANIPEETEYYVLRMDHWNFVFFGNLIINFVVPFFGLMTRSAKRSKKRLATVAIILSVGHLVDIYLMIAPKVFEHAHVHITGFGALQILQWLGYLGLFVLVFAKALSSRNIIPKGDPNLEEGIHLHQ